MTTKTFLSADQLLTDSYQLALNIHNSGIKPDLIIGIWRGGAPIAIAVHEMLQYLGHNCDHIAVRARSYTGIGERSKTVNVDGLDYLQQQKTLKTVLLVDDVFDSGNSIRQIMSDIRQQYGQHTPALLSAVPYFKPDNNQTSIQPDFYLYCTEDWLVFPHELQGLSLEELLTHKKALQPLHAQLSAATNV